MKSLPEKPYLSATRFAHAIDCGLHGWYLSNPSLAKSAVPPSAFERGSFFHNEIEKFYYTEDSVSSALPEDIFLKLPPKSQVIPIKEENKIIEVDGFQLKCMGFPDVPTREMVVELKSGDHKPWHLWQLAFYIWLMDLRKGRLVYFDSDLIIELQDNDPYYKVTDDLVRTVWRRILNQEAVRCKECSGCPIKKDCIQWKGTISEDMINLVGVSEELDNLKSQKASLEGLLIKPLSERIKTLEETERSLRKSIVENNPINNYYMGGYRIRIQETNKTRLPDGFVAPPYTERPDLYKEPEAATSKLNKEFGVKQKEKVAVVEVIADSATTSEASG